MVVNNALQSFGVNTGAFPGLSLDKTNDIKERSKLMSKNSYDQMLLQDDMYKQELSKQKHEDYMKERQMGRMGLEEQSQNTKNVKVKNTNDSVKRMGALADMYRQYGYEHGKNWDSMGDEELISRFNTKNPQVKKLADAFLTGGEDSEYRLSQQLGITGSTGWLDEKAKKDLKDNLWDEVRGSIKTKVNVPINSVKKWGQRTLNDLGSKIYGELLKDTVGDSILGDMGIDVDDAIEEMYDKAINPRVQENIMEYQNKVNEDYRAMEERNMDQNIQRYYDNQGYTKLLKEGDLRGFLYKTVGDAAQNWEMPAVVAVSVLQPEVGFALMGTDTYARESQEAFEAMMDNGADYEQAEKGAVVVGLVNSAIEVGLEKLIGGVETGASKAIRDVFMKNVQEEAVKKGLGRLLAEGALQQLKASGEEGLEEILQQIVQNAAVKTVNENQDLFQGIGQAFEGGFYNPMNLLVGGGNLAANRTAIRDSIRGRGNANIDVDSGNGGDTGGGGIIDRITDWGAQKITGTVSAQDKLYKAQEPRMNVLTKKKDLERRRASSDRANQLIVENGYTPTNTAERLEAHKATLDKLWKNIKNQVNKEGGKKVDQSQMIKALENYIKEKKGLNIAAIDSDIKALEKELQKIKNSQKRFGTDLPTLENRKQVYNDLVDWQGQEASEVLKGGYRLLSAEIGKIEDSILSEVPGEFAQQKRDVGALLESYEDVFKAEMKNQRSKGVGLTEAYSRIEGVGDIIDGAVGVFKGEGGKVLKGAGKILLGKSLAKAKDVDFLVEQGFKELAAEMNKNQKNNQTYKNQIEEGAEPVKEMTSDEEYQEMVNRIMTPEEAKQIVQMAWNANNLKDFYDGQYNNAEEWLKGEGPDQVEMYAENTFSTQRMIESHPELLDSETTFAEVLEAYLNGTLTGKEKVEAGKIDLSESKDYTPTKFYEPQQMGSPQEVREKANQRVTKSNRDEVYQARGEFVIDAHDPNFAKEIGISDVELNKKLRDWAAYPAKAKELSNRINKDVAPEYRWAGLENSSIVKSMTTTDADLEKMVKKVEGNSQEYERKYISNAMLALDTHIDWSTLTFEFSNDKDLAQKILGAYNPYEDKIRILRAGQNTVAHEMGHYLDHLWGRQLYGYNVTLSEGGARDTAKANLTEDQKNFVAHFDNFMTNLRNSSDISSDYLMTPTEMFARFVARFTEWTRNTATSDRFGYETRYYNDKYLQSDYVEFAKLLQEKSKLDLANEYANYEEYKSRWGDKNQESGDKTYESREPDEGSPVREDRYSKNLSKDGSRLSKNVMNKLKEAIYNKKNMANVPFGVIGEKEAQILKEMGHKDTPNEHILTKNGVIHILNNHGENAILMEKEVPVTLEDIAIIPEIVNSPDKVYKGDGKTYSQRRDAIVYEKKIGNKYYYVESYDDLAGNLETQTMYINEP